MSGTIAKQTMEDKIVHHLEIFDNLLNQKEVDHTKLLDQMLKVVVVLMRTSAKLDKNYSLDRETEIWARVNEVAGTYCSKRVLWFNCLSGFGMMLSGAFGMASAIPGTALGNSLSGGWLSLLSGTQKVDGARIHNISTGISSVAQGIGLIPKNIEEFNQRKRTLENAGLEETKQKRQDRKDSHQKHVQNCDKALQHARDLEEKEHRAMEMMQRER